MQAVRPGVELRSLTVHDDEVVLAGGDEVFRLPLAPSAAVRHALHVRALPELRTRLPVAVAPPRYVGVMADGTTPFTAERLLPGSVPTHLGSIAQGQLAGVVAALAAVSAREARHWGVPGDGERLVHEALVHESPDVRVLLADPARAVLSGVTGWRLRLVRARAAGDESLA